MKKLIDAFSGIATNSPETVALIFSGEKTLYGELFSCIQDVSRLMRTEGLREGDCLVILGDRKPWLYTVLLAAWSMKLTVHVVSKKLSNNELTFRFSSLRAQAIVCDKSRVRQLGSLGYRLREWSTALGTIYHTALEDISPAISDCAYVVASSGTTGNAKLIPIANNSLDAFHEVATKLFPILRKEIVTQIFEPDFDLFYYDVLAALGSGGTLMVISREEVWNSLEICATNGVTCWFSVPSLAKMLLDSRKLEMSALPSLRRVLFCGEPLPWSTVSAWKARFPNAEFFNVYGPAEATVFCSVYPIFDGPAPGEGVVPIGSPTSGTEFVVRAEDGSLSSMGRGELCIAGVQLMGSYLAGQPSRAHDDTFVRLSGQQLAYRSGDLVVIDAKGNVDFCGRVDRRFKYAGMFFNAESLESALGEVEGVHEVAVVPETSDKDGICIGVQVFWSCAQAGSLPDEFARNTVESQLQSKFVQLSLASSCPISLYFLRSFPRTVSGKVDYSKLKSSEHSSSSDSPDAFSDLNTWMAKILGISRDVMVEIDRIHDHPNWDSLGHALLTASLSRQLGVYVSPEGCFSKDSIRKLVDESHFVTPIWNSLVKHPETDRVSRGLHGVYLCRTSISNIDEECSELQYRGVELKNLIENVSFFDVCLLLNCGKLPDASLQNEGKDAFAKGVTEAGTEAHQDDCSAYKMASLLLSNSVKLDEIVVTQPKTLPMFIEGMLFAIIGGIEKDTDNPILKLLKAVGTLDSLDASVALDQCLTIAADHGGCASTTAMRCVASTSSPIAGSLSSALAAFCGRRHGGAIELVGRTLEEQVSPERYFETMLGMYSKDRRSCPGFGHRLYSRPDPRIAYLERILKTLPGGQTLSEALADVVAEANKFQHLLHPNVDLYMAGVFHVLGISSRNMTGIFALGRMAGWVAHYMEEVRNSVLIRPRFLHDPDFDMGTK